MSALSALFERLKSRYERTVHTPGALVESRDIVIRGVASGLAGVTDPLDVFMKQDRFLATAVGQTLDRYAETRSTERGFGMPDVLLRTILVDWWWYLKRRGKYRGIDAETLWRLGTMGWVRTPFMALAKKTGVYTPLGLRTCAHKRLGCRIIYWAPAGVSDSDAEAFFATQVPVHIGYSLRRVDSSNLIGGIPEVVVVQQSGDFYDSGLTAFAEVAANPGDDTSDYSLIPEAVAASYLSNAIATGVGTGDISTYAWFVDWRYGEGINLDRITVEMEWSPDGSTGWSGLVEVALGQQVTPPAGSQYFRYKVSFAGTSTSEEVGTVAAGATQFSGNLTLPTLPTFVMLDDGTEKFYDYNGDGTLVGDGGGSGTINYTNGSLELSYSGGATGGTLTAYYWPPFVFDRFTLKALHWQVQ